MGSGSLQLHARDHGPHTLEAHVDVLRMLRCYVIQPGIQRPRYLHPSGALIDSLTQRPGFCSQRRRTCRDALGRDAEDIIPGIRELVISATNDGGGETSRMRMPYRTLARMSGDRRAEIVQDAERFIDSLI